MSFWRGERIAADSTVVNPFDVNRIDSNAYTLCMGQSYYRTGEREVGYEQKKTYIKDGEAFLIPAGQFAFLLTKETVCIPDNAMAFISMKTGLKFQGLINVSGFHVDPGYSGKLIYAVYNASPSSIQLCEGEPLFKIWFADLDAPSGPNFLFDGIGLTDISGEMIKGMNKEVYSLQSLAEQIREQKEAIDAKFAEQKTTIDQLNLIWRTAVMGVIGATIISIFALVLTFTIPSIYGLGKRFYSHWSAATSATYPEKVQPAATGADPKPLPEVPRT